MTQDPYPRETVLGVVLAGGRSRRMGGINKALLKLRGKPLLQHVFARLNGQCGSVIISANADLDAAAESGVPVIADTCADFGGPLAGILSAMDWAVTSRPQTRWILSAPVDAAFLPDDLGAKLWQVSCRTGKPVALARSLDQTHFVCGLWHTGLRGDIHHLLVEQAINRAETIAGECGYATAEWTAASRDPFFNINTPNDLAAAEARLRSLNKIPD